MDGERCSRLRGEQLFARSARPRGGLCHSQGPSRRSAEPAPSRIGAGRPPRPRLGASEPSANADENLGAPAEHHAVRCCVRSTSPRPSTCRWLPPTEDSVWHQDRVARSSASAHSPGRNLGDTNKQKQKSPSGERKTTVRDGPKVAVGRVQARSGVTFSPACLLIRQESRHAFEENLLLTLRPPHGISARGRGASGRGNRRGGRARSPRREVSYRPGRPRGLANSQSPQPTAARRRACHRRGTRTRWFGSRLERHSSPSLLGTHPRIALAQRRVSG